MTDSNMKQVVRDDKLNRKQPYNETYFKKKFVQRGNHKHLRIFTSENEEYE